MEGKMIKVSEPALVGNERKYVLDCLERNWLTMGPYVERLEKEFARFCGTEFALATANGTVALHLILKAMGVGPGDFVVVPNLTYVASANAVAYCGATPLFVDSDATWCMDPEGVRECLDLLAWKVKAVVPVHLYGLPCDMDAIVGLARMFGVPVVEDAAEAFGASIDGKPAGSMGNAGMFSMYANKALTAGEGGMIVTDDAGLHGGLRLLRGQGAKAGQPYWHEEVGYNYRMTDLNAAVGLGQIEKADWHVAKRMGLFGAYCERLSGVPGLSFQPTRPGAVHARWMTVVLLDEAVNRDLVAKKMFEAGVETKPVFRQMTALPMYREHRR